MATNYTLIVHHNIHDLRRAVDPLMTIADPEQLHERIRVVDARPYLSQYADPSMVNPVMIEVGTRRFSIEEAHDLAARLQVAADYAEKVLGSSS